MAKKEYDNSNTGIMYRNEEKDDQHPNWPDFKGSINVTEPGEYWLSSWVKEGKEGGKLAGKKYFSLSFQPKEAGGGRAASKPDRRQQAPPAGASADIPF
jgi:hypothetical protein